MSYRPEEVPEKVRDLGSQKKRNDREQEARPIEKFGLKSFGKRGLAHPGEAQQPSRARLAEPQR